MGLMCDPCTLRVGVATRQQGENNTQLKISKTPQQRQSTLLGCFSLSKNFQITLVSGIIKETGVLLWNNGEKTHEAKFNS